MLPGSIKCRAARRVLTITICIVLQVMVHASPTEPLPSILLDGIGNVANSATNFLTGVMQRQKELLHRVTDTATDYITSAVERPRNLLINATRATTGYIDSAASRGLEFKLRRFLEKFRVRMRNGIPELGIPPLEPFTLDEIVIDTDNPEIGKVHLLIESLEVRKLSTFLIDRAKLSLIGPTIAINISIPEIYATGHYNISGVLGDTYQLHGAGPFQTTVRDFRAYANTALGYNRGMYTKSFVLDFSLRAIKIHLEDFMGGEDIGKIMSKVFEELTPEALDIIKPDILPIIQDYVSSHVNETIRHLTMRDIFHVLLGEYEIGDITHLLIP
ncbi:PREDICTED: uncharacterized protein LOC106750365 isoform X2 [Dinoponera quadriceps]|uniref:Uncharacterized protein LOC106750365 isoform X2 n=1 Tax=Dinoponera quadriceps TaxID=609295 RepID=A0A6P3Y5L8_DINQU|nr:PREDICTED: uncharacterized protein LOC106750365 isoform X2 [Dinoponera quadriceps]